MQKFTLKENFFAISYGIDSAEKKNKMLSRGITMSGDTSQPVFKQGISDTSGQDVLVSAGPRRRWLWWLVVVGGLIMLIMLFGSSVMRWFSAEDSISRERLRTALVTRGDLVRDVSVQGRVVAAVSPTLYAQAGGTITFLVSSGDRVPQDAELAVVDSPELTNRLQQEQSVLTSRRVGLDRQTIQTKQENLANQKIVDLARLELTAAEREARRAEEAIEKEAISRLDFEKAQDELESAQYAHAHAVQDQELNIERLAFEQRTRQLELEQQTLLVEDLKRQVDELTIRSPVAGHVGNLLVDQKTSVSRNQPVLSVVDLTRFEVEAQVPETYADDLALGMQAEISMGADSVHADLISVSPEIIGNQVTARLRFRDGTPEGLRQNQRLTTRILLEEVRDVLMVGRGQFLESGSGRIAYRIDQDIARRQSIQVGARSLNRVQIVSGLAEGDEIIISSTDAYAEFEILLVTD